MDKTLQMMLAGFAEKDIRSELNDYLSTQKQSGGIGERGDKTYGMAISLLAAWFSPNHELKAFCDEAFRLASSLRMDQWLPIHWAVITAAYPFWYNVARQTGRLLSLQEQVTQQQIFGRLKEQYGDRETVARNARYTVRSFVAWKVLEDTVIKGCYTKTVPIIITDHKVALLLIESVLLATPEVNSSLGVLLNNPAFFPFQIPILTGEFISQRSERFEVVRYGTDDMLKLRK